MLFRSHLFYLRSRPDQSIQIFKDSIKRWLDLYLMDPEFGQLFLVDILDEFQFNFEKPAECYFRKLDIIMIRLLNEASVSFLKLMNSLSNQPVNLPSESLNINELKTLGVPFGFKLNGFKTTKIEKGYTSVFLGKKSNPNEFLGKREDLTPDKISEIAKRFKNAGATILGGCCETSPSHIEAIAKIK